MKCYLHIGTEKTATTTIQNFFDVNRIKLLEKGFIYTKNAGRTNHRRLPVAAYNLHRRDDFTKRNGLDTNAELELFQKKVIAKLKDEIESIQIDYRNAKSIVFSSEHIQSRLTEIEEIERLKQILIHLGVVDICVVVYLRRPSDIANSLYSTALKAGAFLEAPPPPSHPYWNNVCNHKKTIQKFSSVFGESAIVPRLFDKNEFFNNTVIDDILHVIGVPKSSYDIPNNANESLSMDGIKILRHLNKAVPVWIDDKPNITRANLVSYIEKHFSDSKYVMPNNLIEEYNSEFQESNEWVRKKYFPDKEMLFPSIIRKEAEPKIPDSEIARIAELFANIWNDKQTRIISLTKQMRSDA